MTSTLNRTDAQITIGEAITRLMPAGVPFRFTAYDGSTAGPADATIHLHLHNDRGLSYLLTAPGDLGMARAYVSGDLTLEGVHPGDPYEAMLLLQREAGFKIPPPAEAFAIVRGLGWSHLKPPPPPPQEALPRWRRLLEGFRHSKGRDAEAIHHHYDVSNRFYEMVLGPSMTYTCAVFPTEDTTLEDAQFAKYDLVCRKLGLQPGMKLLDIGSGWGGMVRHAARHYGAHVVGVTLSREQAAWAQDAIRRDGLDTVAEVRFGDYRDVRDTGFDAVSSIGLTEHIGIRNYPSYFAFMQDKLVPGGRLLNHCITRPDNSVTDSRRVHRPLRVPRRGADRVGPDHHRDPERGPRGPARGEPPRALRADAQGLVREPRGQLGRVRPRGRRGHRQGLGPLHGRLPAVLRAQRDPAAPGARGQARPRRQRAVPAAPDLARLTSPKPLDPAVGTRVDS